MIEINIKDLILSFGGKRYIVGIRTDNEMRFGIPTEIKTLVLEEVDETKYKRFKKLG
ncbi:hypothetical protein IID24_02765 [Patescibacteria group bacterium]|nr:hypothetical protein [Patescibacteria group bacterium]